MPWLTCCQKNESEFKKKQKKKTKSVAEKTNHSLTNYFTQMFYLHTHEKSGTHK